MVKHYRLIKEGIYKRVKNFSIAEVAEKGFLTIVSSGRIYPILSYDDFNDKDKKFIDKEYGKECSVDGSMFIKYRRHIYFLGDFFRTDIKLDNIQIHGIQHTTYSAGYMMELVEDNGSCKMYRFY